MIYAHLVLIFLWLVYCFLHSLLADKAVKTKLEGFLNIPAGQYRIAYNIFALISLIALLLYQFSISTVLLFRFPIITFVIAPVFILTGVVIMIICIKKYFSQLSGLGQAQQDINPVLETNGIHRFVRHPLYLGTFIFLVGLFFYKPFFSNFIAVVIIIVYTIIGIRFEERKLTTLFGDAYTKYKKNVPMLIPFLK